MGTDHMPVIFTTLIDDQEYEFHGATWQMMGGWTYFAMKDGIHVATASDIIEEKAILALVKKIEHNERSTNSRMETLRQRGKRL